MHFEVRTITEAEVPDWCAALNTGFLNPAGAIDAEARRDGLMPLERTWAGFDGGRVVSTLRSFPTTLIVPGGRAVPASAVTAVTTTATHRRRGLATRMIRNELQASVERGEIVSVLIAAEWGIYGRYGYGAATESQTLTVDAAAGRLRQRPAGSVEFVGVDEARAAAPAVFDRQRPHQPGEIERSDRYWDLSYGLLRYPSWREPKPAFHVLARDPAGAVIGVARYTHEAKWTQRQPRGEATVDLFVTSEPAGAGLLWDHLLSTDLTTSIRAGDRSPDDPLPWLLTDARHAWPSDRGDFLWLRPLNVPALLTARTYAVAGRLVLDVVDVDGPAGGRFALDVGAAGMTCERTGHPADLTLTVSALGSVYLGGYGLRVLAAAGLVAEHSPGAVALADLMFRGPGHPWCSTWF
jgi:predicted acetyltransferase